MRGALLVAWVLALALMPAGWAGAQETTHEILIGYNSEQDRRDAEREFAGPKDRLKDRLKVRGHSLESLRVEAISTKALKLRVGLPQAIRAEIARTPSLETAIIQGLADQLKQADRRIAYAHPNWIMRMVPPTPRAASQPTRKRSAAQPSRRQGKRSAKRTRARAAQQHRHRKVSARRRCRCWQPVVWPAPCLHRGWRTAAWRFGH
jgi:hypothetical protein